ncbi:MAG: hypothetical protein KA313_11145 [Pseudarcicella sp.]|nr:hypothetical protein [Pseudarcicella sp.]MBP6411647.1 hypothetical protein [Pseudarcicella sp.]
MIQTFTPNDIIRYAYNETTEEESILIQDCMVNDSTKFDFYLSIIDIQDSLNKIVKEPSQQCVDAILNYASNSSQKALHGR